MTNETDAAAARELRSNPPTNMNLREAALYLGISPRKLWSEAADRRLKVARIGSRLIFTRTELDRYVAVRMEAMRSSE